MVGIYALSLLAIVLWGMSYLWSGQILQRGIPVEYLVFVRILVAAIVLLSVNLALRKNLKIRLKDLPKFLILAMFEPFIYFVCETYGIGLTESPTYSALIISSSPIFSVVAGILIFREKFTLMNLIGILICLSGIVMVTMCSSTVGPHFWIGVVLLLVAVLAEVGHASFTKFLSSDYEPSVIVMYQFLFGLIYLLPLFATMGMRDFDPQVYLSWDVWKPILCLAVLCSSLAFSLWANTIKHLGVAKSSIFMASIPVVTAIAGWMLGQETLDTMQTVGIIIACVGLVLSQFVIKCRK